MDTIDIVDSAFSLAHSTMIVDDVDYTMYMYIGAAVVLLSICVVVYYKYATAKRETETVSNNETSCDGGFCTMNSKPTGDL